jgi:AcrR family transcriptional regulator
MQRGRILAALVSLANDEGLSEATVSAIVARSGVSRRTFYELFPDSQAAIAAAFEHAVQRFAEAVLPAWSEPDCWREQVRGALVALLVALEADRSRAHLLLVESLSAGRVLAERRAQLLGVLAAALDDGRAQSPATITEPPPLTGEALVGAVFAVLHTRLQCREPASLTRLASPLASLIVLPYFGPEAARAELCRPAPRARRAEARGEQGERRESRAAGRAGVSVAGQADDLLPGLGMRLTYRTLRVLVAVGEAPGASNRTIGRLAGIKDQGQISKLLARLQRLGVLVNDNAGVPAHAVPNAWRLTEIGERLLCLGE